MNLPKNVIVNCECCGREMAKGLDGVTTANVCMRCLDVFSKLNPIEPIAIAADRKGLKVKICRPKKRWAIGVRMKGVKSDCLRPLISFSDANYYVTENKMREYIKDFPNLMEGK